jgi:hypothetical protein
MAETDEKDPPEVKAEMEVAGAAFDKAALTLAATPTKSSRFLLLPLNNQEAVLVFGGTLVARTDGNKVSHAINVSSAINFNRKYGLDLCVLLQARFGFTADEIAGSKKRLKLAD